LHSLGIQQPLKNVMGAGKEFDGHLDRLHITVLLLWCLFLLLCILRRSRLGLVRSRTWCGWGGCLLGSRE